MILRQCKQVLSELCMRIKAANVKIFACDVIKMAKSLPGMNQWSFLSGCLLDYFLLIKSNAPFGKKTNRHC